MKIEKNKLVRISNNEKHNENVFELSKIDRRRLPTLC
mgnify:CR=1 FL=1